MFAFKFYLHFTSFQIIRIVLWLILVISSAAVKSRKSEIVRDPISVAPKLGSPAQFDCTVKGYPTPVITWYHNGTQIKEDVSRIVTEHEGTSTLFFLQTFAQHAGQYLCVATNSLSVAKSRPANLSFATASELQNDYATLKSKKFGEETTITVVHVVGESAELPCSLPAGETSQKPTWKMQYDSSSSESASVKFDSRILLTPSYGLAIHKMNLGDEAVYFCQSSQGHLGTKMRLIVNAPPSFSQLPTSLTVPNKTPRVQFDCMAEGKPDPKIRWRRSDGKPLPENRHVIMPGNHALIIEPVTKEDIGLYLCEASNEVGTIQAKASLNLHESEKSGGFVVAPEDRVAVVGETVSLDCVMAAHGFSLYWTKLGSPLSLMPGQKYDNIQGEEGRIWVEKNGTLVITNLSMKDSGVYECTAMMHTTQQQTQSATLQVRAASSYTPPLLLQVPRNETSAPGGNVTLRCRATGFDLPSISWIKDLNKKLSSQSNPRLTLHSTGDLTISNVDIDDAGSYTCLVSSTSGESSWTSTLSVLRNANGAKNDEKNTDSEKKISPDLDYFEGLPPKPEVVFANWVDKSSVKLSWLMENYHVCINCTYRVEYYGIGVRSRWKWSVAVASSKEDSVTVSELSPSTEYMFTVRAQNSFGFGPLSMTPHAIKTLPSVLEKSLSTKPDVELRVISKFSRFAIVTWRVVGDAYSFTDVYKMNLCLSSDDPMSQFMNQELSADSSNWVNLDSQEKFGMACKEIKIRDYRFRSYTIHNLIPFTKYTIFFFANSKTSSPVSADFITGEEIPSQPPQAVSVTERENHIFEVQWSRPEREGLNGALAGYQLLCELTSDQEKDILLNMSVSPNVTSQKVRLPLTKGKVSIKVAARTSMGIGVFSDASMIAIGITRPTNMSWLRDSKFVAVLGGLVWIILLAFCVYVVIRHWFLRRGNTISEAMHRNTLPQNTEFPMIHIPRDISDLEKHHATLNLRNSQSGSSLARFQCQQQHPELVLREGELQIITDFNNRGIPVAYHAGRPYSIYYPPNLSFNTDFTNNVAQNILPPRMKPGSSCLTLPMGTLPHLVENQDRESNVYEEASLPAYHVYSPYGVNGIATRNEYDLLSQTSGSQNSYGTAPNLKGGSVRSSRLRSTGKKNACKQSVPLLTPDKLHVSVGDYSGDLLQKSVEIPSHRSRDSSRESTKHTPEHKASPPSITGGGGGGTNPFLPESPSTSSNTSVDPSPRIPCQINSMPSPKRVLPSAAQVVTLPNPTSAPSMLIRPRMGVTSVHARTIQAPPQNHTPFQTQYGTANALLSTNGNNERYPTTHKLINTSQI